MMVLFSKNISDSIMRMEVRKMEHTVEPNRLVSRTYTAEQVAEILGVSVRKVYLLCEATKDFKVIRMGKRCLRIHKESFDKWFDNMCGIQ